MSVTAVPIRPLEKGSVVKLWLGLFVLAALAAAAAWWTTGKLYFEKTESGVEYQVVTAGEGASPGAADIASINYTVRGADGRVLQTNRGQEPVEQPIGQLPPFLAEPLQLMNKGATWRLRVTPEMAGAAPGMETGQKLLFEVTLVDFRTMSAEEQRQMEMMRMMQQMQMQGTPPPGAEGAPEGAPEGEAPQASPPR